ncbi:Hypothetical protein SMAX5B_011354 [Scophthalmus maximus]|uniref:Uncharacterized protein n=1 Tax=Scophthalmus maximus TaxID=52904 RepID=A0A2U9BQ13_SCOMX|nr:Hypothetical protein SMAX5B_011354 [Scophthalmus maximus]
MPTLEKTVWACLYRRPSFSTFQTLTITLNSAKRRPALFSSPLFCLLLLCPQAPRSHGFVIGHSRDLKKALMEPHVSGAAKEALGGICPDIAELAAATVLRNAKLDEEPTTPRNLTST